MSAPKKPNSRPLKSKPTKSPSNCPNSYWGDKEIRDAGKDIQTSAPLHSAPYRSSAVTQRPMIPRVVLAPMAGVTDQPFRDICAQYGADRVTTEMVSSSVQTNKQGKRQTQKTDLRLRKSKNLGNMPHIVQIAGGDAESMALAAQQNVALGADIIDINMGCPAKKVCKKAAGSALLKDINLVKDILTAVVNAVDVPVTLKCRTGWCENTRNAVEVAQLAEQLGIQSIAIHGRTRACRYNGTAEFDTIAEVKQAISIPLFANGDITSPEKAKAVIEYTGADGVMIGRGAQGAPWIFNQVKTFLSTGELVAAPDINERQTIIMQHLKALHEFYGEVPGIRIARKHIGWYMNAFEQGATFRSQFNQLNCAESQEDALMAFFASGTTLKQNQSGINKEEQAA